MIGIIDYGVGNLRSVQKALEQVGAVARILTDPGQIQSAKRLVLPGVGAYANGMQLLKARGWVDPIKAWVAEGRPLLGICLGMQLLFEGSQEDAAPGGLVPGLGLLPGQVVRIDKTITQPPLKVPHMGWNTLDWQRDDPLLAGLPRQAAVYFVHSFYCVPREHPEQPVTSATTDYGCTLCATVWHGNLWATQFHPEKSQQVGLRMLANFANLTPK